MLLRQTSRLLVTEPQEQKQYLVIFSLILVCKMYSHVPTAVSGKPPMAVGLSEPLVVAVPGIPHMVVGLSEPLVQWLYLANPTWLLVCQNHWYSGCSWQTPHGYWSVRTIGTVAVSGKPHMVVGLSEPLVQWLYLANPTWLLVCQNLWYNGCIWQTPHGCWSVRTIGTVVRIIGTVAVSGKPHMVVGLSEPLVQWLYLANPTWLLVCQNHWYSGCTWQTQHGCWSVRTIGTVAESGKPHMVVGLSEPLVQGLYLANPTWLLVCQNHWYSGCIWQTPHGCWSVKTIGPVAVSGKTHMVVGLSEPFVQQLYLAKSTWLLVCQNHWTSGCIWQPHDCWSVRTIGPVAVSGKPRTTVGLSEIQCNHN